MNQETAAIIDQLPKILPSKSDCVYTSCYCEENVWLMCKNILDNSPDYLPNTSALFISNPSRTVPLWEQKSQSEKDNPVVWDYHVILLQGYWNNEVLSYFIFDLDSSLTFPTSLKEYVAKAFRDDANLYPQYHRYIRVVPALVYLKKFASDRSHMKNDKNEWLASPPDYSCISTETCSMNLNDFISMEKEKDLGLVFSLRDFKNRFNV